MYTATAKPIRAPRPRTGREHPLWERAIKPTMFVASLLPLAWLVAALFTGGLGANPIEALIRALGDWALRFLLLGLAVTPLRRLRRLSVLARLRRMLGLYAFFYALLHLLGYVVLDQFFDWAAIGADILKRPYITIGITAFALLLPLAATSTDASIRRLGGRRWRRLHRLVYPAAILAVVHFYLLVKADIRQPLLYGALLALLLAARLVPRRRP